MQVAITINVSAVLTYKVMMAKSKADVVFTSMWLVFGIFCACVEILALLAIGVALQWPQCFKQDDCRAGMVCTSSLERSGSSLDYRNGTNGFTKPSCDDCYFIAQTGGTRSAPDDSLWSGRVAVGLFGGDKKNATEVCMNQLNELSSLSFASTDPTGFALESTSQSANVSSFARCLFIQETLGKATVLDTVILRVVFFLVAMLSAEDQRQQQLMCRLRRILLPLPLRPEAKTTGSILRWLGILLLTINEFVISLAAPMLPFGTVSLMLTQGVDVSSALLNGLTMGVVLQIDNIVPSIFFSPRVLAEIEKYLVGEAKREMAKKDANGFYGYITASPFIAVATVFMGFITQVYVLGASRSITCNSLLGLLHSRATILFGLWFTGALCFATEEGTRAIIGRQQRLQRPDSSRAIINEDAPVPSARGVPKWVAPVLSMLVAFTRRFVYLLIASLILNCVYLSTVFDLHFAFEIIDARRRLGFVLRHETVFGTGEP